MKKAATIGAALLGLLFLGATSWSQDPPLQRQDATPTFRDVLRGKVGQESDATLSDGIWTLSFPAGAEGITGQGAEEAAPFEIPYHRRPGPSEPEQDEKLRETERIFGTVMRGNVVRERTARSPLTLAAVGADFVQLREADGAERFIPLSRVDVVVRAAGK